MLSETTIFFLIAETKLDNTFPVRTYVIEGFMKPFEYDRDRNGEGGGLFIYMRERVPGKRNTKYEAHDDAECGRNNRNKFQKVNVVSSCNPSPFLSTTTAFIQ